MVADHRTRLIFERGLARAKKRKQDDAKDQPRRKAPQRIAKKERRKKKERKNRVLELCLSIRVSEKV